MNTTAANDIADNFTLEKLRETFARLKALPPAIVGIVCSAATKERLARELGPAFFASAPLGRLTPEIAVDYQLPDDRSEIYRDLTQFRVRCLEIEIRYASIDLQTLENQLATATQHPDKIKIDLDGLRIQHGKAQRILLDLIEKKLKLLDIAPQTASTIISEPHT